MGYCPSCINVCKYFPDDWFTQRVRSGVAAAADRVFEAPAGVHEARALQDTREPACAVDIGRDDVDRGRVIDDVEDLLVVLDDRVEVAAPGFRGKAATSQETVARPRPARKCPMTTELRIEKTR